MRYAADELIQTLTGPRGRLLLARERRELQSLLPQLTGYRFVQIGCWNGLQEWLGKALQAEGGRVQYWTVAARAADGVHVCAEPERLPIASQSVDAVFLPHSLEQAASSHRLLREVDRILCPHGQLIVLGFNPLSPWSLARRLQQLLRRQLQASRFYGAARVGDWLGLLDYEVQELRRFGSFWNGPGGRAVNSRWAERLTAPLAQAYVIFARKRVVPLTPARPRWRQLPKIGAVAMPEARVSRASRAHLRLVK
ncbi:MAG: class I SAM-dependent methyltransferase [Nevskiales bacterium]